MTGSNHVVANFCLNSIAPNTDYATCEHVDFIGETRYEKKWMIKSENEKDSLVVNFLCEQSFFSSLLMFMHSWHCHIINVTEPLFAF